MRRAFAGALVAGVLLTGPAAAQSGESAAARCIGSDAESGDKKARERLCLKELADRAQRTGNTLTLRLDDGKTRVFRSEPGACAKDDASHCASYYLIGFLPSAGRYLIYGSYYESFDCKMVSAHTGKATSFRNIPRFAPDGTTFFVTGYDGTYDNWLGIGSIVSDPPALTWEMGPIVHESWEFVRWIDNDQIAFRDSGTSEKCPEGNCEAILKRTGTAWQLERLPSKGRSK
jgi:hypothetical protein